MSLAPESMVVPVPPLLILWSDKRSDERGAGSTTASGPVRPVSDEHTDFAAAAAIAT